MPRCGDLGGSLESGTLVGQNRAMGTNGVPLVTEDRFSLFPAIVGSGTGMEAVSKPMGLSRFEQLREAREIIRAEGDALLGLASRLTESFCDAVDLCSGCSGCIVITGMGKAGLIGQKLAATLASTGTNSQYLHPGEAIHGDLS